MRRISLLVAILVTIAVLQVCAAERLIIEKPATSEELRKDGFRIVYNLEKYIVVETSNPKLKAQTIRNHRVHQDEELSLMDVDLPSAKWIGADKVWMNSTGNIEVAILDSGVLVNPDIANNVINTVNFVSDEPDYDENGHGTHVTGIVVGVAPDVKVTMIKVCSKKGTCWLSDVLAGMEYAVKNTNASLISMSLGGGLYSKYQKDCDEAIVSQMANWCVDEGVQVIAAIGNFGDLAVVAPGCASGSIGVGATHQNGTWAWFSSVSNALDVVAPGVNISSTCLHQYCNKTGTSMATPHVTGVAALLLSKARLDTNTLKCAIYSTATDYGEPGHDWYYGWGFINADKAYNWLIENHNEYDVNWNFRIDLNELFSAVKDWRTGDLPMGEFMEVVKYWKMGRTFQCPI